MHELRGQRHGARQCVAEFWRRCLLVDLREQRDGQRVVSGVATFVFLEPAFRVLPRQDLAEAPRAGLGPLFLAEQFADAVEAEHDERLVIRQLPALVVVREPTGALLEKLQHLVVLESEQFVALGAGEQRKGRGAARFLIRKIVVAGAVRMGAAGGEHHAGFGPFAERVLPVEGVALELGIPRERERPHEFLRHAAREIDDLVLPVIAVEAAVGRAVAVAVLQRQDLGNPAQGFLREPVPVLFQGVIVHFICGRTRNAARAAGYPRAGGDSRQ